MRWLAIVFGLSTLSAFAADVTGTLQWSRRVELGTAVSGVVTRVAAEPGARVPRGQVLLQLDDRRWRAELAKARAEEERLARVRDEARRQEERARELHDRNLLSNHELEVERIAAANAESEFQAAGAARRQVELSVEYSTLRTPFDALVLDVRAEKGQSVVNDLAVVPLVVVAEADRMAVSIAVEEGSLAALAPGRRVPVTAGGRSFEGTVTRVGLEPLQHGGTPRYPVEVVFRPGAALLRAGQRATVTLP